MPPPIAKTSKDGKASSWFPVFSQNKTADKITTDKIP
jgi:hypothetical protein